MKTIHKTDAYKVETWLPVFSGFYGAIWESDSDEEMEIENINEIRKEKNLSPISYDDIEWNYKEYSQNVAERVTVAVGDELIKRGMIKSIKFQELRSPREYNFANDSINVEIVLLPTNVVKIKKYLDDNIARFAKYLLDTYTSGPGFFSSHSNDVSDWMEDLEDTLQDQHRLGAVLQFILKDEDSADLEYEIRERLHGNGCSLQASNYTELTEGGK